MRVSQLTVARGDDGFLVAWVETPPVFSSDSNVRLAAVVPNRPVALSLPATLAGARAEGLSAVWTGVDYVLVVKRAFDAQAVRIASGGPTIGSPVTITAGGAIASNRNVTYSVGQRVCCGPVIGYPLRTEATLEAGPAEVLNRGPEWQRATALASDGVDFVAVWRNATWSGSESFTRRVDRDGDPGQDGINQLPGPNATPIENGLAFAGSTYLQLYVQDTYLYAQRLSPTGEPMEPRIPIRRYAYNAAVAAAGDRFFVAWREDGGDSYSAFIAADGTMSEPRPMLSRTQPGIIHNIAFDGHGFVVLLLLPSSVIADPFGVPPDLIAVRVALDGAVLDQVPIRLLKFVERAHIASSGRDFLVVADRANDISVVRLKVIAGELQASAPSILSIPTSSAPRADVAWDGRDYAIAWRSTSRLGLVRFSGKGLASSALTIETGATANQPIAIAVNKLGDVVILLSETRDAGVAPRARTYSRGDFSAK
jgi:hypothetical protein